MFRELDRKGTVKGDQVDMSVELCPERQNDGDVGTEEAAQPGQP